MAGPGLSPNQRDFFRIVRAATAIAFGVTAGVLYALRHSGSGLVLEFSFGVIPASIIGAIIGWFYWNLVAKQLGARRSRKQFWTVSILLAFVGLLCFFYPIRYVARGNMSDVVEGILMAFLVVGVIAGLLVLVARLLKAPAHDAHPTTPDDREP